MGFPPFLIVYNEELGAYAWSNEIFEEKKDGNYQRRCQMNDAS